MINDDELEAAFENAEFKQFVKRGRLGIVIASVLVVGFCVVDLAFVGTVRFWEFFQYRIMVVPVGIICWLMIGQPRFQRHGSVVPGHIMCLYLGIYNAILVSKTGYDLSAYYAGLNLVAAGSLYFMPWSLPHAALSMVFTYLPYAVTVLLFADKPINWPIFTANAAFCISSVFLGAVIMLVNKRLRKREYIAQSKLAHELETKRQVIEEQTKRGVLAEMMSKQFSQHVVDQLKHNPSILGEITRRRVTAIFIDIEKSTDRASKIDHDDYFHVLDGFLSAAAEILFKYDITIGAFVGDGLMGFSNAPLKQEDHEFVTIQAALEVLKLHKSKQAYYQSKWRAEFNVKIGVHTHFSSAGFLPTLTRTSYSALGLYVSFAQRLCSVAPPNSLALAKSQALLVSSKLKDVEMRSLGAKKDLKGLEGELIEVFALYPLYQDIEANSCPQCGGKMLVQSDFNEIVLLKCAMCNFQDLQNKAAVQAIAS